MTAYSLKYAKENLERIAEAVIDDSDATTITLDSGRSVVLVDAAVYQNWQEMDHLLSNPANRAHLLASIQDYRDGKTLRKTFEELEQGQAAAQP